MRMRIIEHMLIHHDTNASNSNHSKCLCRNKTISMRALHMRIVGVEKNIRIYSMMFAMLQMFGATAYMTVFDTAEPSNTSRRQSGGKQRKHMTTWDKTSQARHKHVFQNQCDFVSNPSLDQASGDALS